MRLEQRSADRLANLRDPRVTRRPARSNAIRRASGIRTCGAREDGNPPAHRRTEWSAVDQPIARHDADDESGNVALAVGVAGHLGRLPHQGAQRFPRQPADNPSTT